MLPLFLQFIQRIGKTRLSLIVFLVGYCVFLLAGLGYNSVRWDELVHCFGGWQLLQGRLADYAAQNMFYPPMFNLATAGAFVIGGVNVYSARLVAILFSLLSILVSFELANRMYGPKIALLSAVFLGVMPGFFWASRLAYIESMMQFLFVLSLFLFFNWMQTNSNRDLAAAALVLSLGFMVKYQMLAAGIVMLSALCFINRSNFRARLAKFSVLILVVAVTMAAWLALTYLIAPQTLSQWTYAISAGDQQRSAYSVRFPTPVFYFVEMTYPYSEIHPISLPMYILGFVGVGLLAWRRKPQDKFLLIWLLVVYAVFTIVGNRQWRYVMPLFSVLAVSAASAVFFGYEKTRARWQNTTVSTKRALLKFAAGLLVVFTASAVVVSCVDAYGWISMNQVNVPVEEATGYVAARVAPNESVLVVCSFEFFSKGMVDFYLQTKGKQNNVYQYPYLPVDTFTPTFEADELLTQCQESNVKFVLVSEYQWPGGYYNSTLSPNEVLTVLLDSGRFSTYATVGSEPDRIFILSFA